MSREMFNRSVSCKTLGTTEDQLRNIFKKYDTNNDNKLSREDLKKAFDYLGSLIPGFRADRGLHHANASKDGYVNVMEMDELVKYAMRVGFTLKESGDTVTDDQLRKTFKNDGQVSRARIKEEFQYLKNPELNMRVEDAVRLGIYR